MVVHSFFRFFFFFFWGGGEGVVLSLGDWGRKESCYLS